MKDNLTIPDTCSVCSNTKEQGPISQYNNLWLCNSCKEKEINESVAPSGKRIVEKILNQKFCQQCIERGIDPPNIAARELVVGQPLCDECFAAEMERLSPEVPEKLYKLDRVREDFEPGPVLKQVYELLGIPKELQFNSYEELIRNREHFFVIGAKALVNLSEEEIALEAERGAMAFFIVKEMKHRPFEEKIQSLKMQFRKEKNIELEDKVEKYKKSGRPALGSKKMTDDRQKLFQEANKKRALKGQEPMLFSEFSVLMGWSKPKENANGELKK